MSGHTYYAAAHEALAWRVAGATIAAVCRATGWQPSSVRSILSRARHGKLTPPGINNGTARWSAQMDATLLAYWETENGQQLAARIAPLAGRPISPLAVNARANRLGLEKPGSRCDWQARRMGGAKQ